MEILVPYLNNPSEEAIFGSDKIKKKNETMSFKIKKLCSKTLKALINETNQCVSEKLLRKDLFIL